MEEQLLPTMRRPGPTLCLLLCSQLQGIFTSNTTSLHGCLVQDLI